MVDRVLNYAGAVPLDVDLLNTNKNLMIGLGFALQAILGGTTVVDGLACTPTGPASLQVLVAQGSIYSTGNVDGTAFGSLGSDTSHQILKQGMTALGNTTFTCAAPSTSGQSIAYLIQGEYQDVDGGSTVLPYYNASNPAVAYNGPSNSGTSQNTVRQGKLVLNLKAGTSATTGTQVTPTPDAGFTGLWVVTVANGITAITSGMIALYPGAPFINYKLPQLSPTGAGRSVLSGNTTYYVSTTGSDSAAGTVGAPWQTIQHAINVIANTVDLAGFTATIQLADGTYSAGVLSLTPFVGGGANNVVLNGNSGTPSNVVISTSVNCLQAEGSGTGFTYQNLKLTSSGLANVGSNFDAEMLQGVGVIHGAAALYHMYAYQGGNIQINNSYSITGSSPAHFSCDTGGIILLVGGITITLTGTPAFSSAFARIFGSGSNLYFYTAPTAVAAFSGSATGVYYLAQKNGVVDTAGSGGTYLPGNSAGSTATGGQYV